MSKDVRLAHACPHTTIGERVYLETDRMTLIPTQLIGSRASVSVRANGEIEIPSGGLYSSAAIKSFFSGPFNIKKLKNEISFISSSGSVTLQLPISPRLTADSVVSLFRRNTSRDFGITLENEGGHLKATETKKLGAASTLRVEGSAASSLGFGAQKGAVGKKIYPGWKLVVQQDTLVEGFLGLQFLSPVKQNPFFKISYAAPRDLCLRCQGTGVENDYRFNSRGDTVLIENENLLYQAALKIILTHRGSNVFHEAYGTRLHTYPGQKAIQSVSNAISLDVRNALQTFQSIQRRQSTYQRVPLKEQLYQIVSVVVSPSSDDPTIFLLDVVVRNASQERVELSVVFTVPGVFVLNPDGTIKQFGG